MNAAIPVLTLDELVRRACDDQDGVGKIAYERFHMDNAKAERIAARAVDYALDDWEFEHGPAHALPAMLAVAMLHVVEAGLAAREKRFEDARREEELNGARRSLGD